MSGWLCKIKVSNESELKELLDEKAYDSFVQVRPVLPHRHSCLPLQGEGDH
jgi:hypothetical protein